MLVGVALSSILFGYVRWQAKIATERKHMLRSVLESAGLYQPFKETGQAGPKFGIRAFFGDEAIAIIALPYTLYTDSKELEQIKRAFPEAMIISLDPIDREPRRSK